MTRAVLYLAVIANDHRAVGEVSAVVALVSVLQNVVALVKWSHDDVLRELFRSLCKLHGSFQLTLVSFDRLRSFILQLY